MKLLIPAMLGVFCLASNVNAQQTAPGSYHAIELKNLDQSVKPGDNFYEFAVGNWVKNNPVPASKSSWFSFDELYDHNRTVLKEVVYAAASANAAKGTNTQKVGDFFSTSMDSTRLNALGASPLKPYLDKIDEIKDTQGVLSTFTYFDRRGLGTVYNFSVNPDDKNSSKYIPGFGQSGLGLPDKDYYINSDAPSLAIRASYVKHISTMLQLSGQSEAEADKAASDILKLETTLAIASMDRVAMRDPYATYHKMTLADFTKSSPGINWNSQMAELGVNRVDSILVAQPEFFKKLASLVKSEPITTWKEYFRYKLVASTASSLGDKFQEESFDFNGRILNGAKVQEQRWERETSTIDYFMGEALGQEYVKIAFPPAAKVRMLELIKNLKLAFAERIQALDWMSATTKVKALKKLQAIMVKVGYPDKWIDYAKLEIIKGDNFGNYMRAREFNFNRNIARYGKVVDRTIWDMSPPTVNAYYNPGFNEIVFPAGILQPPFFDFKADDAVNYGAIGAVIGHEMTHGFDDQGRQYDYQGNLKDWWTKEDAVKFKEKADRVVRQFSGYTVLDTVHVNGNLTLGENLADLGGTMIAFQAFKKTAQGKSDVKIDGFTPDQRFFLGFSQVWRGNITAENEAVGIKTDPHAPGKWRVIGPLSNNPDFYKAFNIKQGDAMYRKDDVRARIW